MSATWRAYATVAPAGNPYDPQQVNNAIYNSYYNGRLIADMPLVLTTTDANAPNAIALDSGGVDVLIKSVDGASLSLVNNYSDNAEIYVDDTDSVGEAHLIFTTEDGWINLWPLKSNYGYLQIQSEVGDQVELVATSSITNPDMVLTADGDIRVRDNIIPYTGTLPDLGTSVLEFGDVNLTEEIIHPSTATPTLPAGTPTYTPVPRIIASNNATDLILDLRQNADSGIMLLFQGGYAWRAQITAGHGLQFFYSTDGGVTFTKIATLETDGTWTNETL